jgi:tocopherol O-methyltransferase
VKVLDVGCGIGGTTRYLAREKGWEVTGVTISDTQVKMAYDLSKKAAEEIASALSSTTSVESTPASAATSTASTPGPTTPDEAVQPSYTTTMDSPIIPLNAGSVKFIQLDAETISPHFPPSSYNLLWISEALSHLPSKPLFFQNANTLLKPSGRLVIADWVKAPGLSEEQFKLDIEPIEKGMLLPPLATLEDYVKWGEEAGLKVVGEGLDISEEVKKTW